MHASFSCEFSLLVPTARHDLLSRWSFILVKFFVPAVIPDDTFAASVGSQNQIIASIDKQAFPQTFFNIHIRS
jgi:hypothetical protein